MAMLMAGVEYPLVTTALGAGWLLGRMIYALGYTRKDQSNGKGRLAGSFFWLFQFSLFGLAGWTGVKMVM
jgi:glutathione S-transferase